MVLALPEVPIHCPLGSLSLGSTLSRVSWGNSASIPSPARLPREPGSCRNTTSAGVLSPSSRRVAAVDALPPYFTRMSIPVDSPKASRRGCTRDWERPEYTVRERSSCSVDSARVGASVAGADVGSAALAAACAGSAGVVGAGEGDCSPPPQPTIDSTSTVTPARAGSQCIRP